MRRGLKERVLDMAVGDLLPDSRSGELEPGQRMDVCSRTCDGTDRRLWLDAATSVMGSCGDGNLHRCLGASDLS